MGIATDARIYAEEAKKVSASVKETTDGIALKVKSVEKGYEDVKGEVELSVKKDKDGNLTTAFHVDAGMMTVDTDDFKLDEDGNATFSGELKAAKGTFSGELQAASGTFGGDVESVGEELGFEYRAALEGGIVKIKTNCAYAKVGDSNSYVPLLELNYAGTVYVLVVVLNENVPPSLAIKPKGYFGTAM
jgi:hypothetical protein